MEEGVSSTLSLCLDTPERKRKKKEKSKDKPNFFIILSDVHGYFMFISESIASCISYCLSELYYPYLFFFSE